MSTTGIVLAILNIIAAVGFGVLATMDLGMRRAWAYSVYRYDLAIDGLPVDTKDTYESGRPKYLDLDEGLLHELFKDTSIRTQEDALTVLQNDLLTKIEGDQVKGNKVDKILDVLGLLAPTALERDQILVQKNNKDLVKYTDLVQQFNKIFDDTRALKDQEAKRDAIANILLATYDALPAKGQKIDPGSDPAFLRLQYVIGAKEMGKMLDVQTSQLARINSDMKAARALERGQFADKHQTLINTLIDREHKLREIMDILEAKTRQATIQTEREAKQRQLLEDLKKKFAAEQAETAEALRKLGIEQEDVFRLRERYRDANRINQELERFIRELEKKAPAEKGPAR